MQAPLKITLEDELIHWECKTVASAKRAGSSKTGRPCEADDKRCSPDATSDKISHKNGSSPKEEIALKPGRLVPRGLV